MGGFDEDLVRHALKTARDHAFVEVEVSSDRGSFRATLEAGGRARKLQDGDPVRAAPQPEAEFAMIRSPIVGFYRLGTQALEPGKRINRGDVVAVINALGIANDVESHIAGEVVEVLVRDGQAVEFGQLLAKVKA